MSRPPRPAAPRTTRRALLRALLAGVVLFGAVGSCELPKPKLPSIGAASGAGVAAAVVPARRGGTR